MKITIYTIKDCAFSKQEKEYLTANKLMFEERDLETNKDFLTEMLAISNNFAGTPVTRVEKDDGTIAVLKGFTKEEFDTTFGLAPMPASPVAEAGAPAEPVAPTEAPVTPVIDVPPVVEAPTEVASPEVPPTTTVPNETPLETPIGDQDLSKEVAGPLQSVMDSLKSKSAEPTPAPVPPTEPASAPPVVDQGAPAIPDFPAK
jgi:glutaredoxin